MASEAAREIARRALYTLSPSAWCRRELKLELDPWQVRMVDAPAASRVIALTFARPAKRPRRPSALPTPCCGASRQAPRWFSRRRSGKAPN